MSKKIEKLVAKIWASNDIAVKRDLITKIVEAWNKPKGAIIHVVKTATAQKLDQIAGNILLHDEDIAVIR